MTHILISATDNPSQFKKTDILGSKQFLTFNEYGLEARFNFLINYFLIENCTESDFLKISSEVEIYYRVIEDSLLAREKINAFGGLRL